MTELLVRLKARLEITDNTKDALLKECLSNAMWSYVELRLPYSKYSLDADGNPVIEHRYISWVVTAAVEFYNKLGAEGQNAHSENGVSRSYETSDLSESLRIKITPKIGVVR